MDVRTFQRELTRIGGLNDRGEPNLRVVRGDQEFVFAYGRVIPKYFVPGGAKKTELRTFRIRDVNTNTLRPASFEDAKKAWESLDDLDNPLVVEVSREVKIEPQCREGYFVEQYIPPEKIKDTPEQWERNRYGFWYDETKAKEVWVDKIGPFPLTGRYECFVESPNLTLEVLETVGRAWRARNEWKQTVSDELLARDMFRAGKEREDREVAQDVDRVNSELAPHLLGGGMYMSSENPLKSNKKTKHGRAK
jgi:hypothetical protein